MYELGYYAIVAGVAFLLGAAIMYLCSWLANKHNEQVKLDFMDECEKLTGANSERVLELIKDWVQDAHTLAEMRAVTGKGPKELLDALCNGEYAMQGAMPYYPIGTLIFINLSATNDYKQTLGYRILLITEIMYGPVKAHAWIAEEANKMGGIVTNLQIIAPIKH